MKDYMDFLIDRDSVKQPYQDRNATDRRGKPLVRCPVCHFVLTLRMEQFCPSCGQRFVDSPNDQFYETRKGLKVKSHEYNA